MVGRVLWSVGRSDEVGELRAENALLREQLAAMMVEMAELRRLLGQNSSKLARGRRPAIRRRRPSELARAFGAQGGWSARS